MRIVGGRLRGRTLAAPNSDAIRPTADKLREALFNILLHRYDDPITGARVLDLFAGTGALGCEAASRGAAFVLFVDEGAQARALQRQNVEALGLGGSTRIFRRDATRLGPVHPLAPFSLAFLDPPYGQGLAEHALASAREGGWLTPDALVVVEEATSAAFAAPDGYTELERRSYGDSRADLLAQDPLESGRGRGSACRRSRALWLPSDCVAGLGHLGTRGPSLCQAGPGSLFLGVASGSRHAHALDGMFAKFIRRIHDNISYEPRLAHKRNRAKMIWFHRLMTDVEPRKRSTFSGAFVLRQHFTDWLGDLTTT